MTRFQKTCWSRPESATIRPSWVDTISKRVGDTWREVVVTDEFSTVEECRLVDDIRAVAQKGGCREAGAVTAGGELTAVENRQTDPAPLRLEIPTSRPSTHGSPMDFFFDAVAHRWRD